MQQPSMIFEPFEIVIVPFPFVDRPIAKPRPALVLSAAEFNRHNGHTLLAMITTAARTHWPSDSPIADLEPTGLLRDCVVRWKLFTLDNRVLGRRSGALGGQDRQRCRAALERMLGSGEDLGHSSD
jgi:mRNA interferase MazF